MITLKSSLVIVPMGDERQDADEAIRTLADIAQDGRAADVRISARILFTRIKPAAKSAFETRINRSMRERLGCLETELVARSAYSGLHSTGGTLAAAGQGGNIDNARSNAKAFADEVLAIMETIKA